MTVCRTVNAQRREIPWRTFLSVVSHPGQGQFFDFDLSIVGVISATIKDGDFLGAACGLTLRINRKQR